MTRLPLRTRSAKASSHRPDHELIAGCLKGDAASWDALIARYAALIYSICLRMGLSQADAEDVFQDVTLILLNHLDTLRDTTRLAGWLALTTKREVWRVQKRRAPKLASELGEGEWEMEGAEGVGTAQAPSPEADILALEEQQVMREGMARLPERCRKLLSLLYGSDDPPAYADIAVQFGLPVGSIGPTRARCLQHLKKLLVELEY